MDSSKGASQTVAVVGCGYWGANLIRNFSSLGALAAVVDESRAAAEKAGSEHGVPALDWAQVLADDAISGVVISTPAESHAELALEALAADKNVFVEKPLALTVNDATKVRDAAIASGKLLMVGHLLQYHPAFRELKVLVDAGALGKIRYAYSNRLNFGRIRRVENILWSFSPHDLSMILALMQQEPDEVWATGSSYLQPRIADVTTTHMSFPGGQAAHVFVSWLHPYKEQKLVVVGERGMAVFDDTMGWDSKLQLYAHEVDWVDGMPQPSRAEARAIPILHQEPLELECKHFLERMKDGAPPLTDGDEAIRVLKVLERAEASMNSDVESRPYRVYGAEVSIHPTAVVDENVEMGPGTKVWHFAHVLGGSVIGSECVLGQNVMVGPDVTIGDRCKIQNNVSVYRGVTIEDDVFVGPSAVFTNVLTPRAEVDRRDEFSPTLVRKGATIGANATIVCGNDLGSYCMVAAGAVVTRSVPAHALMAGVPARRIGWVSHAGERLGPDLICPRSGRRYREESDSELTEIIDD
jgi:predicted dehydrogenase/acetyltransferase-like isoleucine patch superfamily enzyme